MFLGFNVLGWLWEIGEELWRTEQLVIGAIREKSCEEHLLEVERLSDWWYLTIMMQKIVSELNGPYVPSTELEKHKYREDLIESTDVVSARYPPKVKCERESLQL